MFDRIEHPNNMRNGDNDAELQIKLDHALLRALKAEVCTDTQCRQCSAVNTIERFIGITNSKVMSVGKKHIVFSLGPPNLQFKPPLLDRKK